ncbi:hypothetical protein LINGRAHAP2_LOCUS2100, partial [Linum grandiflorum]
FIVSHSCRRLDRYYLAPHSGNLEGSSRVRRGFRGEKKESCQNFRLYSIRGIETESHDGSAEVRTRNKESRSDFIKKSENV